MLTNSKFALSVALVLATASVAMAAPMDPVRHNTATRRQVPAGTYCVLVYQCAKLFKLTDAQRAAYVTCFGKTPQRNPAIREAVTNLDQSHLEPRVLDLLRVRRVPLVPAARLCGPGMYA